MNPENLINWGELSRLLAGNRTSIYRNRIPKKHQEKINELIRCLEKWYETAKPAKNTNPENEV